MLEKIAVYNSTIPKTYIIYLLNQWRGQIMEINQAYQYLQVKM